MQTRRITEKRTNEGQTNNNREPEGKNKKSRQQEGNKGNRKRNDRIEKYGGMEANRKLSLFMVT